jgi:ubiquinone/menaquinone biosynthesis C-methylase UbiE
MRVADIGAGTGLFTLPMADAVGAEGVVYAVDIAEPFVKHIEERAREAGYENIRGVVCTERSVELPRNSIDLAFLCDTYHHLEYPKTTLASLRRALKPGGEVFVVDFKRVPGESSEWVMNHVRAGQATVEAELTEAGFEKVADLPLLMDNYVIRFRSTGN